MNNFPQLAQGALQLLKRVSVAGQEVDGYMAVRAFLQGVVTGQIECATKKPDAPASEPVKPRREKPPIKSRMLTADEMAQD